MSLISPDEPARAARRSRAPDLRRPLVADRSRQGPARLRRRAPARRRLRGRRPRPRGGGGPGRHPLPSPADFVARMERIGIGDDSEVVAYDDAGGTIAARLWWMLDDLGHRDVRVLDGGIAAWVAAGGPLTAAVTVVSRRAASPCAEAGRGRSIATHSRRGWDRWRSSMPGHPSAIAARSSRSTPFPATSRRPSACRLLATSGRTAASSPQRSPGAVRGPGRRCRVLLRERGERLPQRPGDARGRAARPAPLPRVLQRLVAGRDAGGDGRRAGHGTTGWYERADRAAGRDYASPGARRPGSAHGPPAPG